MKKRDEATALSPRRQTRRILPRGVRRVLETTPKVVGPADPLLTAAIVGLIAFGVVMVFSASAVYAHRMGLSPYHYLIRQSIYALVGIAVMFVVARFDYHWVRPFTYPVLAMSAALMMLVVLGFGRAAGGASRWLQVGPVNIQPAEMTKVALILWLAYSLSKKREQIRDFSVGFLPHALMAGALMLLSLKQPDFGSAVMMGLLTFVMLFTAGAKLGYLIGAVMLGLPAVYFLIASSAYRMRRIQAFLAPFEHRQDEGYQVAESLISFGHGGATGVGLGDGGQKLLYLPEAHTDFISAIVGEELGFVGVLALILVFAFVVLRGLRVGLRAVDAYGTYLAVGVSAFLGLQAMTNLAVAMGMLPTKGLVLPFMSYGGSSLLVNSAAMGLLLNVSRPRVLVAEDVSTRVEPEKEPAPESATPKRKRRQRNMRPAESALALRKGARA